MRPVHVALSPAIRQCKAVQIPWTSLQPSTLRAIVEEFITREGTDYGEVELSLQQKVDAVMLQLKNGTIAIFYDDESESCTLQPLDHRRVPRS